MRAIIETVFDIFYLVTVLTLGIRMIRGSKDNTQFRLFGLMAVVLGAGDSFHLVPRALALCTTGLENYAVPLGLGKIGTLLDTPQSAALIQQLLPELAQYVQQEPGSRGISVNDLQFYSNKMFDEEKLAALNEALAKLN